MDKSPSSPKPSQINQILEKGAQIKNYISDTVSERLRTMQGRPPAQFSTAYKSRDDDKHAVDLTEKSCERILIACCMTLVMLILGATLVGGILLAVLKLDIPEDTVTVGALNLNIKCPRDIVTRAEPGGRHAIVSWEPPELQEVPSNMNLSDVTFESNYQPNTSFAIGDHVVVYTVTDLEDNQETCSFKVKVRDRERPVFVSCPHKIKIVTDKHDGSYPDPTWDTPKAVDNAGPPTLSTNYDGKGAFELGTTMVRYTATDAAKNFARCVFQVIIIDGTPPTILGCPEDLTSPSAQAEWRPPTAVDNGLLVSVDSDWESGDTFPIGRTRVTYVAEDSVGLKAECSFVVAVVDTEAPIFTSCPSNITVTTDEHGTFQAPTWETPRAVDSSGPPRITTNHEGEELQLDRATKVVYVATDLAGNSAKCSFYVMVEDGTPPTILGCPSDMTQPTDRGTPTAHVYWSPPTARDNGEVVEFNSNQQPGDIFPLGVTKVVYTAVDSAGLRNECSFAITIRDIEIPKFTFCPSNIEKNTDEDGNFDQPIWPVPMATDNSGPPQVTTTYKSEEFELGVKTPVQYVATDASGNNATCLFYVTVIDETPPVISECPSDVTITNDPNSSTGRGNWTAPKATDNGVPITLTSSAEPGDAFSIGRTRVTYTAVDDRGLVTTCHFTVTVLDGTPPSIHGCPSDITQPTDRGRPNARVFWSQPTAQDNWELADFSSTQLPGDIFTLGATEVVYTAEDSAWLRTECRFTVKIRDLEVPKFTFCPSNIDKSTDSNGNFDQPTWPVPVATDNSGPPQVTTTYQSEEFELGVKTPVQYVATDASGNNATCLFYVTVIDETPPVISDCPQDVTITNDPSSSTGRGNWTAPTATDNGVPITLTSSAEPGDAFRIGRTRVTYTAVDDRGLATTCHFTVTVLDGTPPSIHGCPSDITQPTDRGRANARVFWSQPTAQDNWELADFSSTQLPGDIFTLGATEVVYTAEDSAGLRTECNFIVIIRDLEGPKFTFCPSNIEKSTNQDGNFDPPTWPFPIATDNTGLPRVGAAQELGKFELGLKTPVKYTATDASGNNATCLFYVTIIDGTPPELSECPSDITITTNPHSPTGRVNWTAPTATDNGVQVTLTSTAEPGDAFRIGRTRVIYTAVDNAGLTTDCYFTVTVLDNEAPVFTHCPADIIRITDASGKYAYPIWQNPQAVDNSGEPPQITTKHRFQMYELNSRTRIEYFATDASGNNVTCVFHIEVVDGTPPELRNCPDDITFSTDPNTSTSQVNWSLPQVSDNSQSVDLTSDWKNGDLFPLGSTVVTFTAVDLSGLTSSCHFTVTVIDTEDPVFTYCPEDLERTTDAKGKYLPPMWETPEAVDNSGQVEVSTTFDFAPFELGVTTPIEYTATDPDNNRATCIFFVTILDGTRPVITHCPPNVNASTDPRLPTARVTWTEPTAKDNSGYVRLTSTMSSGDSFPLGRTKVVYTALDAAGMRNRCRFFVTVEDYEDPVFDFCPEDIVKETNEDGKFDYPTWFYPHAVDNSGAVPDITTSSTFQVYPLEEPTPIEYFAEDQAGNRASCRFYVTVKDRTPPLITDCPGDIIVSIDPRSATGRPTWKQPIASDNGRLVSFESDWDSGDTFPAGDTNVTYIALDSVGLTSKCQFTVTVEARCNLSVSTPIMRNTYRYRFPFPTTRPSTDDSPLRFDFAVRSSGTVYVALAEAEQSTDVYEIGLGRSKTFIRCGVQCRPHYITLKLPNLISPAEYRHFWITYDGTQGLVRVGKGREAPFMEWQDPSSTSLDVQRLGIASYQRANWKGYLCRNGTSRGMGWL